MTERRAVPGADADPTIAALPAGTRALLAELWTERAASELAAGEAFAAVERDLQALDADPAVLALAARAVADEPEHAGLCMLLAEAYHGAPLPLPAPRAFQLPVHEGADDVLRRHLHVIGLCCINESIAVAFVAACLADAAGPLLAAVHREHLADEIGHARVGWAHLGSARVDADVRAALIPWLPRLLSANLAVWSVRIGILPEAGVPGHALPPARQLRAATIAAAREIIVPGFAHVGLPTAASSAAVDRAAR